MTAETKKVNQIVHRPARRVYGVEAKARIARELHGVVITASATHCRNPLWWTDLRRKRLQSWGAMLRLLDVLIESGASDETVLTVPDALRAYALDQIAARDNHPRAA